MPQDLRFEDGTIVGVPDLLFDAIKQLDQIKAEYITGKNLVDSEILRIFNSVFPEGMANRPIGLDIKIEEKKLVAILEKPEEVKE